MTPADNTRSRVLAAALDEFAAKGYAAVRVDQIAASAGVNKAMIYYHFAGKEDLFNALFAAELSALQDEMVKILAGRDAGSPPDMAAAARDLLAYARSKRKVLSVLMSGLAQQADMQQRLFDLLDASAAAGTEAARAAGLSLPEEGMPALLHELFSRLLPLVCFVLLREGLSARYGWDLQELDALFLAQWLRGHVGV